MDSKILCPTCNSNLTEFENLFSCKYCHTFNKDIFNNLYLKDKDMFFVSKKLAYEISKIQSKLNFETLIRDILPSVKNAESIYISGICNTFHAKIISSLLPGAHIYINSYTKKQMKCENSSGNITFVFSDTCNFCANSFDAVFIFGNDEMPIKLLSDKGKAFRIFSTANTGREIRCFGFPEIPYKIKTFFEMIETKRYSISKRVFIERNEFEAFTKLFCPRSKITTPNDYSGRFVTAEISVSEYEKK